MMSDQLPEGWVKTALEDCVDILDSHRIPINANDREKRISGKEPSALYPYYGATGQVGWIDDFLFDEEIILLGEDGAPFLDADKDKAYLVRGKSWVNNHAHVLKARSGIAINLFLMHYLNYFDYQGYVTGTTRLKLNQGQMRRFPIFLPPLAEQERIVAKIEALFSQLDAGVAALRRIQAALKRYKASVLKAACEGWLVGQDPTDEPAEALLWRLGKAPLVDDDLPALPEGWCWVRVGDITAPVEKVLPQNKYSDQFIYLDISSIDNMKHSIVEPKRYSKSEAPSRARQLVQTNDILFSTVRTYLENVAMVPEIYDGQIASTGFSVLRAGAMVVPKFMFYYILTNSFLEPLNELQRGTSYPAVRDGDVRIQPFPLPPLGEQEAITSQLEQRLSVVAEVEAVVAALLARSARLRQAILKQAFEGKLV